MDQMQQQQQQRRNASSRKYVLTLAFVSACVVLLLRSPENSTSSKSITPPRSTSTKEVKVKTTTTKKENKKNKIKQISLLGERNSGTRWTYDHVSECFNHSIKVERTLTRYKHWFQDESLGSYPYDTLVLAQFRNPYDWFKAMEHVPHHSPAHLRTAPGATTNDKSAMNDWKIFLTKPWTTERIGEDLKLFGNETCQEKFNYRDIVSCIQSPLPHSAYNYTIRYSEDQPFYEMKQDGSGTPYANIMEMRTDKIRNFLNVSNYKGVTDVWVLQYEYLLAKGTEHMIKRIEEWTGIKAQCEAKPPQVRKPKQSRLITTEYAKFIRTHLNWTVEEYIGYKPELFREEEKSEQWRI